MAQSHTRGLWIVHYMLVWVVCCCVGMRMPLVFLAVSARVWSAWAVDYMLYVCVFVCVFKPCPYTIGRRSPYKRRGGWVWKWIFLKVSSLTLTALTNDMWVCFLMCVMTGIGNWDDRVERNRTTWWYLDDRERGQCVCARRIRSCDHHSRA